MATSIDDTILDQARETYGRLARLDPQSTWTRTFRVALFDWGVSPFPYALVDPEAPWSSR